MSYVTEFPAASSAVAEAHFLAKLSVETDCADVHAAMREEERDFVLLHVVGSKAAFDRRHIPGALHLPWREISAERMSAWPQGTLFVVYCAGPHCNGADRAALCLARLGVPVKIMTGGLTGWADEGYAFAGEAISLADI